jgi:predicted acylesterase/phospholipase RssA
METKDVTDLIGVFGGGGALGAYTCGILSVERPEFSFCYGTSTGSLIAALAVLGKYDELAEAYCSITADKIFDNNPFTKGGNIKLFAITKMLLKKSEGLASATGLEKLIRRYYTEPDHKRLQRTKRGFVVTATKISERPSGVVYFNSRTTDYNDMVLAILASCSVPVVFTPVRIKDHLYVDGGVAEPVPIEKARKDFPNAVIETYVHQVQEGMIEPEQVKINGIGSVMGSVISIAMDEINKGDMKHVRKGEHVHKLPYKLSNNALLFDQKTMEDWYKMGKGFALQNPHK